MVDYTPRINNACPFPPGINPPEKKSTHFNQIKHLKYFIYDKIFISRRAATALIFLILLTTTLAFPWIKHNVVVPYLTPRFDGVIVYVDGYSGSWDGCIRSSDHNFVQAISGNYAEEYLLSRPTDLLDWNVTITVRSWIWLDDPIPVRIVNGTSGEILSEGVTRYDEKINSIVTSASVKVDRMPLRTS